MSTRRAAGSGELRVWASVSCGFECLAVAMSPADDESQATLPSYLS
ncbi:MAG: hypothetical protein ACF8CQ_09840 [Rhodopirellula sp. JB044]